MNPPWLNALVAVASLLFGGGGLAILVKTIVEAFTGSRGRKADTADRLSDSTLKWVQEFQEETMNARREAAEYRQETASARLEAAQARRELAEMRREMDAVRMEAEALAGELRNTRAAIMSPSMTIERLRVLVEGNQANGRPG